MVLAISTSIHLYAHLHDKGENDRQESEAQSGVLAVWSPVRTNHLVTEQAPDRQKCNPLANYLDNKAIHKDLVGL